MKLTWPFLLGILAALLLLQLQAAAQEEPQLIESVKVVGNDYIPKEGILDEVKDILPPGQPFTPERSRAAQQAVSAMGYFEDVQITTGPGEHGVIVSITVVEKQRVQKILFVGNTVVDDATLADVIFTKVGHVFDNRIIRRDVSRIEDYYGERGYIASVSGASQGQFGVLTFVIEEARVEDIVIEGLKKTKKFVVERALTIKPGELFRRDAVAEDIKRLYNLGIFENVTSDIRPGVKDPQRGIILVIQIQEKRTGEASLAAGYSNLDKFVLIVSVSENNFRGRAERVSANVELFGRTSFEVSFFEPYLDKKGTSFSGRLYDTQRNRRFAGGTAFTATDDTFDERRTGGTFALSRPLSRNTRASLRFRSEKVSSSFFQATRTIDSSEGGSNIAQNGNLPDGDSQIIPPDNPDLLPEEPEPGDTLEPIVVAAPLHPGGRLTSFTAGWTRDTRDLISEPTRGTYTTLSLEQAGSFFGGSTTFSKLMAEQRYYRLVSKKRKDVLAFRLMGGLTNGNLPFFETFSVGGANTLRGYEEDRFRGSNMLLMNVEYRYPISDRLTAVGFVDVGDAFGGSFRTVVPGFDIPADDPDFKAHTGVGVGLRVVTPVGPIRLDFGFGEEGGQAHFNFGHTF